MADRILIDPLTRIEGHLAIKVEVESNRIINAFSMGEMFRGFEVILQGRDPLDAQQITQRICGVCPISHGTASILAQDQAYGIKPPRNGRLLRNLILGANYLQSHILHFYHLSALDFIDITAIVKYQGKDPDMCDLKGWVQSQLDSNTMYPAAPFLPRYDFEGAYIQDTELNLGAIQHYLEALEARKLAHQMAAVFCGKIPHAPALVPGGITEKVTAEKIATYRSLLKKVLTFVNSSYLPDIVAIASVSPEHFKTGKGCGNFLAYGVFPESSNQDSTLLPSGVLMNGQLNSFSPERISEDVSYAKFSSQSGLHPARGETTPNPHKSGAYSWIKAPRYSGSVVEVGPLARMLVAYHSGKNQKVKPLIDSVLNQLTLKPEDLVSTLGRHAARALESKIIAERCAEWIEAVVPGESAFQDFDIPESSRGMGLTEAPRGALGHWLEIQDYKISRYQCVVPTTWNCSPRDDRGNPGPVEQALIGTPVVDSKNPIEATRVVRSFDPCLACAVH